LREEERARRAEAREKAAAGGKMVQRLTYRKRHSYATKSNQTRVVKTPGKIGHVARSIARCFCSCGLRR
jgi:hypothetical protein